MEALQSRFSPYVDYALETLSVTLILNSENHFYNFAEIAIQLYGEKYEAINLYTRHCAYRRYHNCAWSKYCS